ncbi:MAG: CHAT domain-containing protein [Paracoccaceae bacterium]
MTRKVLTTGLLGVFLGLAGCAGSENGDNTSANNQLCKQVARLSQDAKRNAFSLDYPAAERGFRSMIALYNETPDLQNCGIAASPAQAHMNLGLVLSNQRRYLLADVSFETAERLLQDRDNALALSDRMQLGAYLQQHALNRNDTPNARRHAQETLALLDQFKSSDLAVIGDSELFAVDEQTQNRLISEAQTYYALGFADLSEAKIDGVEARSLQAIDVIKALPSTGLRARFALQQAVAQSARGNWRMAAATAEDAARELEDTLANSPLLARALLVQATALSFTENRELAYETFEQAFAVYEQAPVDLNYESVWPFIKFVSDGAKRGEITEEERAALIFRAGQLVRGSFTAYDIAAAAATFEAGASAQSQAVRDWRDAENRLARLRGAQAQVDRLLPEQIVELERQIAEASEAEADLRVRRDELAPAYADAINAPVALPAVAELLQPDEVLVQILTGNPSSTVLAIDAEGTTVAQVEIPRVLLDSFGLPDQNAFFDRIVNDMRASFNVGADSKFRAFEPTAANVLYRLLFGGIQEQIAGKKRLFITTNGVLQSIPLDVLVVDNPAPLADRWQNGDYSGLQWLGDQVELSYLPSPRNLVDIRSRAQQSRASNPVIAFGGFETQTTVQSVLERTGLPNKCRDAAELIAGLPALPRSGEEVARITNALGNGSRRVTGPDFTEEAVLDLANQGTLKDYQVLHFATHGLVWPIEDCFNEPALATSVGPGALSDGLLTSSEIRSMELDAQFVVLSACDTIGVGGNFEISGENLSGLARSFFSSGSRSVMASHWKVDDALTAQIMGEMYESLAETPAMGFGAALRQARATIRNTPEQSHPANWAAFVVIGDGTLGLVPRSGDS